MSNVVEIQQIKRKFLQPPFNKFCILGLTLHTYHGELQKTETINLTLTVKVIKLKRPDQHLRDKN